MLKEDYSEALRLLKMAEDLATDFFDDISEEQADVLLRTAQILLLKREEESSWCIHIFSPMMNRAQTSRLSLSSLCSCQGRGAPKQGS